ncbi:hypothetical protein M0D21_15395 [Aquimarina sp. D1M17]|uniref:hypothetical protein n=1 Tax=Aquimarina acroporae TaxID=2937283 RepID=UPI0020BF9AD4|nr:hypothetical protein [Aquimarina acroporae]MCK8522961.1 hypothetical protein [Aquimarina acroporae]
MMNNINFREWAFRFVVWDFIIQVITFLLTINYIDFSSTAYSVSITLFYLNTLSGALLILSVIFIIISSIEKEKKNYQYWGTIIGIFLFGVFPKIVGVFL